MDDRIEEKEQQFYNILTRVGSMGGKMLEILVALSKIRLTMG